MQEQGSRRLTTEDGFGGGLGARATAIGSGGVRVTAIRNAVLQMRELS
jgi:hypothetical protein